MEHRIAPPGAPELAQTIDMLVGEGAAVKSIFKSKQKVLMFAAAVGWQARTRVKVDKKGEGIRLSVFQNVLDEGFINSLAIAETGDLKILSADREEERLTIFEEYAHGGLIEIRRVLDGPGNALDQLLSLVIDAREPQGEPPGVAADLARLLGV